MVNRTMQPEVIVTDTELPAKVMEAIVDGRKIEAIKMLRESTGLGLANAKVLIDRASRIHGPKNSPNPFVPQAAGLTKLFAALIAILVLAACYYFIVGS